MEENKKVKIGFFDIIRDIVEKRGIILKNEKEIDEVYDSSSWWPLNIFLSLTGENSIILINMLQKYANTLDRLSYLKFLYFTFPKKKHQFIKYLKKDPSLNIQDEIAKEAKNMVAEYYKCSLTQAREYVNLLSDKEILVLAKQFGEKYSKLIDLLTKEQEENGL